MTSTLFLPVDFELDAEDRRAIETIREELRMARFARGALLTNPIAMVLLSGKAIPAMLTVTTYQWREWSEALASDAATYIRRKRAFDVAVVRLLDNPTPAARARFWSQIVQSLQESL